jgi:murein DD-endopeptidase MepM/ murein hydrolase activator NlpD
MKYLLLILLLPFCSCSVLQSSSVVYRVSRQMPDTAHVYLLPFAPGTAHRVWQGYHSLFSHWGNFAIDFRMQPGTVIHAARGGVVAGIKDEYSAGGVGRRYVGKENAIVVRHQDDTYAHYLHIQSRGALVRLGDTVTQGQPIAVSGSTGFSAFPHLHFEVTGSPQKAKDEVPVWFLTHRGVQFLRPLRKYRAVGSE